MGGKGRKGEGKGRERGKGQWDASKY